MRAGPVEGLHRAAALPVPPLKPSRVAESPKFLRRDGHARALTLPQQERVWRWGCGGAGERGRWKRLRRRTFGAADRSQQAVGLGGGSRGLKVTALVRIKALLHQIDLDNRGGAVSLPANRRIAAQQKCRCCVEMVFHMPGGKSDGAAPCWQTVPPAAMAAVTEAGASAPAAPNAKMPTNDSGEFEA